MEHTPGCVADTPELERVHVQDVYDRIADHFSRTRYAVCVSFALLVSSLFSCHFFFLHERALGLEPRPTGMAGPRGVPQEPGRARPRRGRRLWQRQVPGARGRARPAHGRLRRVPRARAHQRRARLRVPRVRRPPHAPPPWLCGLQCTPIPPLSPFLPFIHRLCLSLSAGRRHLHCGRAPLQHAGAPHPGHRCLPRPPVPSPHAPMLTSHLVLLLPLARHRSLRASCGRAAASW